MGFHDVHIRGLGVLLVYLEATKMQDMWPGLDHLVALAIQVPLGDTLQIIGKYMKIIRKSRKI